MKPPWEDYTGDYEKEEYAIILKITGELVKPCWPNAGKFYALDGSRRTIDGEDVFRIRKCEWSEHSLNTKE